MEIRGALLENGSFVGWRMIMQAKKPGNMTAFIAVDDFRYFTFF